MITELVLDHGWTKSDAKYLADLEHGNILKVKSLVSKLSGSKAFEQRKTEERIFNQGGLA